MAGLTTQPRYEEDAAEVRSIISEVIDDVDLRVQEAVARHGLPRTRSFLDTGDAESILHAFAPRIRVEVDGPPLVPHGLLEAAARLAIAVQPDGHMLIASQAAETSDTGTTIELAGTTPPSSGGIPLAPPTSFAPDGVGPVPALLALLYYLTLPGGAVAIDLEESPYVRISVK